MIELHDLCELCGVCNQSIANQQSISTISPCGHCVHTICISNTKQLKCYTCNASFSNIKYSTVRVYYDPLAVLNELLHLNDSHDHTITDQITALRCEEDALITQQQSIHAQLSDYTVKIDEYKSLITVLKREIDLCNRSVSDAENEIHRLQYQNKKLQLSYHKYNSTSTTLQPQYKANELLSGTMSQSDELNELSIQQLQQSLKHQRLQYQRLCNEYNNGAQHIEQAVTNATNSIADSNSRYSECQRRHEQYTSQANNNESTYQLQQYKLQALNSILQQMSKQNNVVDEASIDKSIVINTANRPTITQLSKAIPINKNKLNNALRSVSNMSKHQFDNLSLRSTPTNAHTY